MAVGQRIRPKPGNLRRLPSRMLGRKTDSRNPDQVGTLAVRYICDTLTTDYEFGPLGTPDVDLLNEQVAGTNDATQNTDAEMPHLTTGAIGNGHNVLQFTQTAQQKMNLTTGFSAAQAAVGIVLKPTTTSINNFICGRSGNSSYRLQISSNNQIALVVANTSYETTGTPVASTTAWLNLLAVWEASGGADGCRIYINGELRASLDTSANANSVFVGILGARNGLANGDHFHGQIAEFNHWSSLLSAADALALHNGWQDRYGEW